MRYLFDNQKLAKQGSTIVWSLLESQSPPLSNIAEKMTGNSASGYKMIRRFLPKVEHRHQKTVQDIIVKYLTSTAFRIALCKDKCTFFHYRRTNFLPRTILEIATEL